MSNAHTPKSEKYVTILHGVEYMTYEGEVIERMFSHYGDTFVPADAYKVMYGYVADSTDLDIIYRRNNTVDGDEWSALHKTRSLSVGDIIFVTGGDNDGMHAVMATGFHALQGEEVHAVLNRVKKGWKR